MADLLITGGRVVDPSQELDAAADVFIRDGLVAFVGEPAAAQAQAGNNVPRLDATGKVVTPGLIDMHVHLREPGMEQEETIASGAAAAVAGGFTSVACMPNTEPALDSEANVTFVCQEARKTDLARVYPVGSITSAREGKELAEMGQMARGGAVAFSDDGAAVPSAGLLRRALSYAAMLGKPLLEHCEEPSLSGSGVMHEGYMSTALGLPGIPAEAEEIVVARDLALAKLTGARLHIQHVSTAGSVELIRRAKEQGIAVTAEVTPHHLVLTDEHVKTYNPDFKVNPPLRTKCDVRACIQALAEGIIDAIASDHAPHLPEEKELEFSAAPCGVIGLETTLGVVLTHLVHKGELSLGRAVHAMTAAPARILALPGGTLKSGCPGDATVIDLEVAWEVDPAAFQSRSANCPFRGASLRGRAVAAVVGGSVKFPF